MKHYDVVIIGGGPSGISAGISLIKAGYNCCILDKNSFPRNKLCGGLVTQKSYELINEITNHEHIIDNSIIDKSNNVTIYNKNKKIVSSNINSTLFFIDRNVFDNSMKEYYEAIGGLFFDNIKIKTINNKINNIILENDETIKYTYIIAADGALSMLRNKIYNKKIHLGFCLEVNTTNNNKISQNHHSVSIYFNIIKNGYGWVFPSQQEEKIGFGNLYDKDFNYKKAFLEFVNKEKFNIENINNIKGAFVPYGEYLKHPATTNILFVGDAAGFVDPILGEGLYFSFLSGKLAADAIIQNRYNVEESYVKLSKIITKQIKWANIYKKLFFNILLQKLFFKKLENNKLFLKIFIDKQISLYTYKYKKLYKIYFKYKSIKRNKNVD